jgi:hypothetical protein
MQILLISRSSQEVVLQKRTRMNEIGKSVIISNVRNLIILSYGLFLKSQSLYYYYRGQKYKNFLIK